MILAISFALIGFSFYFKDGRRLSVKFAWKAYHAKGEQLKYLFNKENFLIIEKNAESKMKYDIIKYLYEDKLRFYLLISERLGYIIPKRDLECDEKLFRNYIESITELKMSNLNLDKKNKFTIPDKRK